MSNDIFQLTIDKFKPNEKKEIIPPFPIRIEQINIVGGIIRGRVEDENGISFGRMVEGMIILPSWKIILESGVGGADRVVIFCQEISIEPLS